jgi:hypothetical protein
MPMIFPGMDPYLEHPVLWTGAHTMLIVDMLDFLQPLLRPRYIGAIEERVVVEGVPRERIPDLWVQRSKRKPNGAVAMLEPDAPVVVTVAKLEIHQRYLQILDTLFDNRLVTVIELVSPTNKYEGAGRRSYLEKQHEVLDSKTHLVEIDLLRTGPHVLAVPEWVVKAHEPYHYLACVNRAKGSREEFDLYPRTLAQPLPKIAIPLAGDDDDVVLDVQTALERTYERGAYFDRLDYNSPCIPRLSKKDQAWANSLIRKAHRPRRRSPNGRK